MENKKQNTIAICWPGKKVAEIFYTHRNVIYFEDGKWNVVNDLGRRNPASISEGIDHIKDIDPSEIRTAVYKWLPVIYRWTKLGANAEHIISETVLHILRLIVEIRSLKIKFMVFHTGVPHHYDSMIMSVACELSAVKQIFLYANVFDGKLIPLFQDGSLDKRKIFHWKGGGDVYDNLINNYISNRLRGITPATSDPQTYIANWWKSNTLLAVVYVFFRRSMHYMALLKKILARKKESKPLELADYSAIDHVKMIAAQRSYLKELYRASAGNRSQFVKPSELELVIAAHYQPEATSFPEGWDYYSHIDIVIKLRSLGYHKSLYYKEHYGTRFFIERFVGLTRVGICRSKEYFDALTRLGCVFVDSDEPISLQSNSIPITITGTVAIERSLLGLHTIIFGRPWYIGLPGTIHVDEIKSLGCIPQEWGECNPDIAVKAKNYLCEMLNHNTLTNVAGIGTGAVCNDSLSHQNFEQECIVLFSKLSSSDC